MTASTKSAFTLIEMLVIISVTLVLSTILIGYSRESSRQLLLINSQAKLVSLISRSKSLSTATFLENSSLPTGPSDPRICGYGIHLDQGAGEVFIFRDMAVNCSTSDKKFALGDAKLSGQLDIFKMDKNTTQFADTTLSDVVFVPPDPTVVINGDGSVQEAVLGIELKDQSSKVIVKINNAGRISTR